MGGQWSDRHTQGAEGRPLGALAAILGVALAARLALLVWTRHLAIRDDSSDYQRLGRLLAGGHGFGRTVLAAGGGPTAFRAPAYPVFLGGVFRLTGDSMLAARAAQAVLGTVTVGMIGLVVTLLFDRRCGLVAAAIGSVYPPLLFLGNGLLTESISLPLEMAVIALALRYRQASPSGDPDHRWIRPALLAGCGLLIGVATLTRPVDAILVVPVAVLVSRRVDRAACGRVAVLAGATLLLVLPWEIRDARAFHRLLPVTTQDGFVLAGVYNDQAAHDHHHPAVWRSPAFVPGVAPLFADARLGEADLNDALRRRAQAYARGHPAFVARVVVTSIAHLFDLTGFGDGQTAASSLGYGTTVANVWIVSSYTVGLVALLGLALGRRVRAVPLALGLVPVLFVASTVPTLGTLRYRSPVEPYLVMFAAVGLVEMQAGWRRRRLAVDA